MAAITAAVAVGASAVGGAMKASAQSKAAKRAANAAAFNPYNITGAGGSVTFGPGGQATVRDDAQSRQFREMFGGQAMNLLGGGAANQQSIENAAAFGNAMLPGTMMGALQSSDASGLAGGVDAFTNYSMNNAMMGQQGGQAALGQAAAFGSRQTGINEGMAQNLFGQGLQALGNTDFSQLADQQIAAQRAFARPGEERAVNAKFGNLFNRGVLSQTGGERQIGELALAQEQADIQRVMGAQQFANQLGQQNRAFGLGAIGQGFGARAQDQQFNLGAANMFSGMGQNLMQFGQQAAGQGLQAQQGFNELLNTRGQQRLQNVTQMLGFGQNLQQSNINQALGLFGGIQGLNANQRQLIALGGNLGGQQSAAGAQQGQFMMQGAGSPMGGFLSGMGSGIMGAFSSGAIGG
jgi:hypothetical protein